ncbi:HIT domain-containing protein [Candidatus Sneabacter namystus]|uniref:HIT domain-containing protein n=1 Tax=Candidatus Sneabacter namystus TaxID=2601646 RepID=A0A5C0UJA2_9RICK|nr:HIT domain-containing protein [Candidatus Sneabacter namystus]QEK39542.1 HIT domain-containing protein [Candidatus Sneabacter namystus]
MTNKYDDNNVFAKILRGDLPSDKIYEDDFILAFKDIQPVAEVHLLAIPKKPYIDMQDFIHRSSNEELRYFFSTIEKIATISKLDDGYRIVSNFGKHQLIPHFHVHIIGGEIDAMSKKTKAQLLKKL